MRCEGKMLLDMAIYSRMRILIAEKEMKERRRISYRTIAKETGLSLGTVADYAAGKNARFDSGVLETLCQYFNCQPGDLLVYSDTRP